MSQEPAEVETQAMDEPAPTVAPRVAHRPVRPQPPFRVVLAGMFTGGVWEGPQENARTAVERLAKLAGGTLQDEMDITTDILVLGSAPEIPPRPAPDADALTRDIYQRRSAELQRWRRFHEHAVAYRVRVMNEAAFLHWIGYFDGGTALAER